MATMLAMVETAAEADHALRAGAGRVGLRLGRTDWPSLRAGVEHPLWNRVSLVLDEAPAPPDLRDLIEAASARGVGDLRFPLGKRPPLAPDLNLALIGIVDATVALRAETLDLAAAFGLQGLMVAGSRSDRTRLLDQLSMPELAALAAGCRARGLSLGLSGALEWPDVPRLLALGPDELAFDRVLRLEAHPDGPIDPDRVRIALDLMTRPTHTTADDASPPVQRPEPDRIFVRDWVLSISIGAYAGERDALQRVRFSVEAEVQRRAAKAADLRDVVSYDLITDAIRRLVAVHVDLVETLAERIAESVLVHPRILGVSVTVEKLDLGPGAVGCRIERRSKPG